MINGIKYLTIFHPKMITKESGVKISVLRFSKDPDSILR